MKLGRNERFAFLANLYNAKTIDIVLDAYPVKSIKDIALGGGLVAAVTGGPWKAKVIKLRSHDLSLDDLEHGLLRKAFKDRVSITPSIARRLDARTCSSAPSPAPISIPSSTPRPAPT